MTVWTGTWSPESLPEEGFDAIDYYQELKNISGINFEWKIIAYANRSENLAVLLASDDLNDLSVGIASYYSDSQAKIIDDGFLINICDYFDYTPNYRRLVWSMTTLTLRQSKRRIAGQSPHGCPLSRLTRSRIWAYTFAAPGAEKSALTRTI
jgi:hypothetical protein